MRKQELYDFIDKKLFDKRQELLKENQELKEQIKEVIAKEVVGLDGLSKSFSNLIEIMEKAKEEHAESTDYYLDRKIRDAHNCIPFKKLLVDMIFNNTAELYLINGRDTELRILEKKYPNTLVLINEVKTKYERLVRAAKDTQKLKIELEAVIKASTNAKDAFKNLTALGVDMKGFEESSAKLPVVQKLSVDVCIINGNC